MSLDSGIEWTESTWNPVTGCTKVSEGCKNCYAERMARRLKAMGMRNYNNGFDLTLHWDSLEIPLSWKKPQIIFVNSMSDLFHEEVPLDFILKTFEVMRKAFWHQFQILTKRSKRLNDMHKKLIWSDNIWMGVSVENQENVYRIDMLRATNAKTKFISFEPLIGPIDEYSLMDIDWVIVGGESGPGSRPIKNSWVTDIRDMCIKENVPFFFKQWGGFNRKKAGRILEGKEWNQMPEIKLNKSNDIRVINEEQSVFCDSIRS